MSELLVPVILSGGKGTRLWPLSRQDHPKQLLPLVGEGTCLQQTGQRVKHRYEAPIVVTSHAYRFAVAEQLQEVGCEPETVLLEPKGRNTAAACAVAALAIAHKREDQVMAILPSDHYIKDEQVFHDTLHKAVPVARTGRIVCLGIEPNHAATAYGYIKRGASVVNYPEAMAVDAFTEKPDQKMAELFVESGDYVWNSGIFVTTVTTFLAELRKHAPKVVAAAYKALMNAEKDYDFTRLNEEAYADSPDISIDYAVMEKTDKAAVVTCDMGWSDMGSYQQLWEHTKQDEDENAIIGDAAIAGSRRNFVHSHGRLTTLIGVDDLIVASTADVVWVANRKHDHHISELVKQLDANGRKETYQQNEIYRPWGSYRPLYTDDGVQVKALYIKPGSRMSLQKHEKRSEHWVVISGTARITINDETKEVQENESIFVPLGCIHRIENATEEMLKIIEVQSGDYIGEDDIVRLEDDFGRSDTSISEQKEPKEEAS